MRFKGLRVSRGGCSFGAGLVTGLSRMASTACLTDCTREPAVAKEAFSRPKEPSLPGPQPGMFGIQEDLMARLEQHDRTEFLASNAGWELDGETIKKTYVLGDFSQAIGFVTRVAMLAEVADHHPDIDIRWNRVTIVLSTHDEQSLTAQDTSLAIAIEAL